MIAFLIISRFDPCHKKSIIYACSNRIIILFCPWMFSNIFAILIKPQVKKAKMMVGLGFPHHFPLLRDFLYILSISNIILYIYLLEMFWALLIFHEFLFSQEKLKRFSRDRKILLNKGIKPPMRLDQLGHTTLLYNIHQINIIDDIFVQVNIIIYNISSRGVHFSQEKGNLKMLYIYMHLGKITSCWMEWAIYSREREREREREEFLSKNCKHTWLESGKNYLG
ncbi:hypothetical protein ACJX0J_012369 [Zea mays]